MLFVIHTFESAKYPHLCTGTTRTSDARVFKATCDLYDSLNVRYVIGTEE